MMRIIYMLSFVFLAFISFGQSRFVADNVMHKFPKTNEGMQLEHAYTISNMGNEPLIISSYDVACTCTKVTLPPPIPPGGTAEIVVKFDTNGKYYLQDRKITLHTNTKKKTEYLHFKAYIIPEDEMKR